MDPVLLGRLRAKRDSVGRMLTLAEYRAIEENWLQERSAQKEAARLQALSPSNSAAQVAACLLKPGAIDEAFPPTDDELQERKRLDAYYGDLTVTAKVISVGRLEDGEEQ